MSSGLRDAVDLLRQAVGATCAYGVPGMAGVYALGFWFEFPHALFRSFLKPAEASPALVVAISFALAGGFLLGAFRWAVFEMTLCRGYRLSESTTENLDASRRRALHHAREKHYRKHQVTAHLALVLPLAFAGFLSKHAPFMSWERVILISAAFAVLVTITAGAACASYKEWVSSVARLVTSDTAAIPFRRAHGTKGAEAS